MPRNSKNPIQPHRRGRSFMDFLLIPPRYTKHGAHSRTISPSFQVPIEVAAVHSRQVPTPSISAKEAKTKRTFPLSTVRASCILFQSQLPGSVTVAQEILVLFVQVRILAG